jgi:hypothetical protein
MSVKKIFISYSTVNTGTAEIIEEAMKDVFPNLVHIFLAAKKITSGDLWQKNIQKNLVGGDVLVSLVTTNFLNKPWFYIEWTPFWMDGRPFFLLLTDDIDEDDLVAPMLDRQITRVQTSHGIEKFFISLHKLIHDLEDVSDEDELKYKEIAESVVGKIELTLKKEQQSIFEKYKDGAESLPGSSLESEEILNHYFVRGDFSTVHSLLSQLRDEEDKKKIAVNTLENGNFDLMMLICRTSTRADKLTEIAERMIQMNLLESKELYEICEMIRSKKEAEINRIATLLMDLGKYETDFFYYIVGSLENRIYLTRIAEKVFGEQKKNTRLLQILTPKMIGNKNYSVPYFQKVDALAPSFLAEWYEANKDELNQDDKSIIWLKGFLDGK